LLSRLASVKRERARAWSFVGCGALVLRVAAAHAQASPIVSSEFIFEKAPFASAHASTIVETKDGLLAAWFGGSREGASDVGIWLSRRTRAGWSAPHEVANGRESDATRFACWNPVLARSPDGTLLLFFKVGPQVAAWWGMLQTSRDDGDTWTEARRLPDGILGPTKNKPVFLTNGELLAGSSTESFDSPPVWRIQFERTTNLGRTWSVTSLPSAPGAAEIEAIQPAILVHGGDTLQALGRTRSGRVFETWSADGGRRWSPLSLTELPNPNAGIDAVTLRDGRHLIAYNHTTSGRTRLDVAVSNDGKRWSAPVVLERATGEYSYPAVIQTADGLVHVTYTWNRTTIKHVVLDPALLR
jgi:predicted neuraminidase